MEARKGDVLAKVESKHEAYDVMMAFMPYYRENGQPKERAHDFVPRIGLEEIKKNVLDEVSGEPERLRERLRKAKEATSDPWLERRNNLTENQFTREVGHL
jgi:nitrite reductase (NADH) large subunit